MSGNVLGCFKNGGDMKRITKHALTIIAPISFILLNMYVCISLYIHMEILSTPDGTEIKYSIMSGRDAQTNPPRKILKFLKFLEVVMVFYIFLKCNIHFLLHYSQPQESC